jgi:hypothetical protein
VADADKAAEVSWLLANVMGPDQAVWALRITARNRYSDRCWCWGEPLGIAMECAADRPWKALEQCNGGGRSSGRRGTIGLCSGSVAAFDRWHTCEHRYGVPETGRSGLV